MGRKKSRSGASEEDWEAYAAAMADHREAVSGDASPTPCSCEKKQESPVASLMVTADEYFLMLRQAAKEVYSVGTNPSQKWHPEDIGIQIDAVNEILIQGFSALYKSRSGRYVI